ncbi:polymorphic toxin type 50 domain-containing protein [Heyndrickxia ginsengihumi]
MTKKIGYYVDNNGNHIFTSNFEIRYSKTGVHIFPTKG